MHTKNNDYGVSVDNEFDEELERRLQRLESPGGGGMVQDDLPLSDILWCVAVLVVVGSALVWWAF